MHDDTINEKPVWGAKAIGAEINLSERQTYYLLEKGDLPARRIGNRWCAYPKALRRSLAAQAPA